jgi:hypothetical protein
MRKHSFTRDDLMAVVYIWVGGLIVVLTFLGFGVAKANDLSGAYSIGEARCVSKVVTATYYADDVHVPCDVQPWQQLNLLLPRGVSHRNAVYLADQFGGVLRGRRLVVDIDF